MIINCLLIRYLPPYTSFVMTRNGEWDSRNCEIKKNKEKNFAEYLIFSLRSYLAIFIIIVCITEKDKMNEDPLNFDVLNIIFEVIR